MDNLELVDSSDVEGVICENVTSEDIEEIINIAVPQMKGIMKARDGIGVAGPQVGINKRFSVYRIPNTETYNIIFNGMYVKEGSRTQMMEGCLSYPPGNSTKVKRFKKIKVMYEIWNEEKKELEKVTRRVTGVEAVILQHEIDHWNGKTIYTK